MELICWPRGAVFPLLGDRIVVCTRVVCSNITIFSTKLNQQDRSQKVIK
jgi:hypothetical protein